MCLNCHHICQKPLNFTYAFKCYQNNVTSKNVSWPYFSWATLYIYRNIAREGPSNLGSKAIMHKMSVKFGRVVFELCERTDRQTDRRTRNHHNTSHPSWEQGLALYPIMTISWIFLRGLFYRIWLNFSRLWRRLVVRGVVLECYCSNIALSLQSAW